MESMETTANHVENGALEDVPKKATKRKMSLSNCGVCGSEEARYRCPACSKHSCSLSCVKTHKESSGCSGVRDKTAFVALSHFNETHLLSDYRLLEDTGRMVDGAARDRLARTRFKFRANMLAAGARKLNITLRFLPGSFTKSRENSTIRINKENQFRWHLKLLFPQSLSEFSERRVPHERTLAQILTHYIHPTESDPILRQRLKVYAQARPDHVKLFMKAEGRKANCTRYHELDPQKSLKDNLSYKTLIEFPVFHVVLKGNFHKYPLKGAVEPTAACGDRAKRPCPGGEGGREGAACAPPPHPRAPVQQGNGGSDGTRPRPAKEKRAERRPEEEEEVEEGEVTDSSDDEEEEEGEVTDEVVNKDEDDDNVFPAADEERDQSAVPGNAEC